MISMTVILAAAALALGLAKWWRLPPVPLLIVTGVLLSASHAFPDERDLEHAVLLGLTFLVFAAGTELNPRRVGAQGKAAVWVGLGQFFLLGSIGLVTARMLGLELLPALYMGLALAASSTLVVVRLLQERKQFFEPFGRLVLGVLLVQDVLVILFISILSATSYAWPEVAYGLMGTVGLVVLSGAFTRWVTPYLLVKLTLDEESLLLTVLSILFVFVGLSQLLELPFVVGAFLAGVSLSGFPVNGLVRGQLISISNFFLAVFFVALGATLVLPGGWDFLLAVVLIFLVVVLTPPLVTAIAERAGLTARSGIEGGLLLSQTSEFSLIVALIGVDQGHIDQSLLAVIALVTVVTMMLTPFLATTKMVWRLMRLHPSRRRPEPVQPPAGHILLLGCGERGRKLLEKLLERERHIVVVDEDPAIIEQVRKLGVQAIRGDGADFRVLQAAGARSARTIICTLRRLKDNLSVLKFVKGVRVIVSVFEEEEAAQIRARGGIPVLYSHAAAEEFLKWFDAHFAGRARAAASAR